MEHESPRARAKPVVGLAGGIGAGKSKVARILASLGARVIDSDALAHQELRDPEVIRTLTEWWGESILDPDGQVDRSRLAARVFAHAEEKARLEGLLHPRVARRRESLIWELERDDAVRAVVLDSPLLFETGLNRRCDSVVFVDAEASVRAERVRRTRGWSEEELHRREKLQAPLDKKRSGADHTVVNNSDEDDLRTQVVRLFNRLLEISTPT
jgi:dephospho-CoA kinase